MSDLKVVPLGAGQDVGRSCILVSLGGKNIMFDCGMHMGYQDDRRFPDFSYISQGILRLEWIINLDRYTCWIVQFSRYSS